MMLVMLPKTYEALREPGASEETAREAAIEIAHLDRRLLPMEVTAGATLAAVIASLVLIIIFVI